MKSILIALLSLVPLFTIAQSVGINNDGSTPYPGAILDIKSDDKGVLIPRIESTAVSNPAEGMLIYQPSDQSFYFYKSLAWEKIYAGTSAEGPSFETTTANLIRSTGTVDNENFIIGRSTIPDYIDISDKFFFYDQNSGAFRGGELENTQIWSPVNLGSNSFAYGKNVKADAPSGIALGQDIEITANSVAFAIGYQDTVTASLGSGAIGRGNVVNGTSGNIAIGENNHIDVNSSNGSVALGQGNSILGSKSGVAIGAGLINVIDSAVVIGRNNSLSGYPIDLAFAVGNGTNEYDALSPHQDGLVIRTNGYTGINNNVPGDVLHIRNTARKPNEGIVLTGDTLNNHVHLLLNNRNEGGRNYGMLSTGGGSPFGQGKFIIRDVGFANQMLTLDSLGNLGLRTTDPTDDIHLKVFPGNESGGITVEGGSDTKESHLILDAEANDGKSFLIASTGLGATVGEEKFIIKDANAGVERLVINSAGDVGIGEIDPIARLEIKTKAILNDGVVVSGDPTTMHVQLKLENNGSDGHHYNLFSTGGLSGFGDGKFIIRDATETVNRLVIEPNGNVGLGLDDPTVRLEVKTDAISNDGIHVSGDPITSHVQLRLENNGTDGHHYNLFSTGGISGFGNGKFIIRDASETVNRLVIEPDGNVGLGIDDPTVRLEVKTNEVTNDGILVSGDPMTDHVQLGLDNNGTDGHYYNLFSTGGTSGFGDGKFIIRDITESNNRMVISASGKVGIGENNPTEKLHIKGAIVLDTALTLTPGTIQFKNNEFQGHDGTGWVAFGPELTTTIFDGDGDTGIDVEESVDEDILRLKLANSSRFLFNKTVGKSAHMDFVDVGKNIILGDKADQNTADGGNIFIGEDVALNTIDGRKNVFIGASSGQDLSSGQNVAIGFEALQSATSTTNGHVAIGAKAGKSMNSVVPFISTTAIGYRAAENATAAGIFIGPFSGSQVTGTHNIMIGYLSGEDITTGTRNVMIGDGTGTITDAATSDIVIIGDDAGKAAGSYSTIIGSDAGSAAGGSGTNTLIGYRSGQLVTDSGNTMVGLHSGAFTTAGHSNTFVGDNAGIDNTQGDNNIYIGFESGKEQLIGNRNTVVGTRAGVNFSDGSGNVLIGYEAASFPSSSYANATAIGTYSLLGGSETVRIGNTAMTSIGGYEPWSNLSDGRFKTNVQSNVPGLDFINKLNPVTYNVQVSELNDFLYGEGKFDDNPEMQNAITKKEAIVQSGFIAQEVEAAARETNYNFNGVEKPTDENQTYRLSYSQFVVPLVKAVQEQQAQIQEQKKMLEAQQQQIDALLKLVKK